MSEEQATESKLDPNTDQLDAATDTQTGTTEPIGLQIHRAAVEDLIPLAADALAMIPEIQRLEQALRRTQRFARPLADNPSADETSRHILMIQALDEHYADIQSLLEKTSDLSRKWTNCSAPLVAITQTEVLGMVSRGPQYVDHFLKSNGMHIQILDVWKCYVDELEKLRATYGDVAEYLGYATAQFTALFGQA